MYMKCVHMNWPFSKIRLADQKIKIDMAFFFYSAKKFLVGRLIETHVSFLKKVLFLPYCYSNDEHQQPTSKSTFQCWMSTAVSLSTCWEQCCSVQLY